MADTGAGGLKWFSQQKIVFLQSLLVQRGDSRASGCTFIRFVRFCRYSASALNAARYDHNYVDGDIWPHQSVKTCLDGKTDLFCMK